MAKTLLVCVLGIQAAHMAVLFVWHSAISSNLLQLLAPLLTILICTFKAYQSKVSQRTEPWFLLISAFALWMLAQTLFLLAHFSANYALLGSASDALWLIFPLPLLLVASQFPNTSSHDAVSWLDIAQASLFFVSLFALAYLKPAIVSLTSAYIVQSIAIFFACTLRYSMTAPGQEREFYRKLAWFATYYASFSIIGSVGQASGLRTGSRIDLCWSAPFSFFSILTLLPSRPLPGLATKVSRLSNPTRLQGISAHSLTAMSLTAAAMLAYHRPYQGGAALLLVFLLSAARTSVRDSQSQTFREQLLRAALHDPLTGLPNRNCLREDLAGRLERATVTGPQSAVLFLDLDQLQLVNDGLGYSLGDVLLQTVARLLTDLLRPGDVVGRTGGDEFAILFDVVDAQQAQEMGEAMLATLRQPINVEGRTLTVTASAGLALQAPDLSADLLIQAANCAMYTSKRLGRNQVRQFVPAMLEAARHHQRLYADLRIAVEADQIEVHYQPIYNLQENTIAGFEALARWRHPDHGEVSPTEFIQVAEEGGLIVALGRQVLRDACQQCSAWNRRFGSALTVSVNVSAHQLVQPGLLDTVVAALHDAGLGPELLKLEVTETALLSLSQDTVDLVGQLRSLGIGFSLDDFGTGYSSLQYMLQLPFDLLKIDQSFVRSLDLDPRRAQIVKSVIELAAKLGMKIVAEGVESHQTLALLREHHCDMVQGYLLAKPLMPSAVHLLLHQLSHVEASDATVWRLLSDNSPHRQLVIPPSRVSPRPTRLCASL